MDAYKAICIGERLLIIMTGEQFRESLRKLNREIYYLGTRIEDVVEHPATKPHSQTPFTFTSICL